MKDFDQEIREALRQEPVPVPGAVHDRMEQLLSDLPEKETTRRIRFLPRVTAMAASLLFVMLILLPNVSVGYARAVEQIPVIGDLVQIFTIRTYLYDENNHNLGAQIPAVSDRENPAVSDLINKDVDELTSAVIRKFYEELEFAEGQGTGAIRIDYETLTNDPEWFTMKLMVEEIRGSTYSYARYYHIDRKAGTYVHFGDLFDKESFPALEEMIVEQMREQMENDSRIVYRIDENEAGEPYASLDEDQNFYFRDNGDLVIAYDRYEVAPGFMGCPEFVLTREQIEPYLSADYQ